MKAYIMRGLPGSGKSTWLKENCPNAVIYSADYYHMVGNKYEFKQENAAIAHNTALQGFVYACYQNYPLIAVDNTNIRIFEIAPYYRVAEAFGYDVEIIEFFISPNEAYKRNTHNVPMEIIMKMFNGFEALPPWWKRTVI